MTVQGARAVLASRCRRPGWTSKKTVVVAVGLLSLGLSLWNMLVPGHPNFFDSGVYLAASVNLVRGILPYRDFVFVQPPGLLLLASPIAIFSRIFGTHDGLVLANLVNASVMAIDAGLLAWLVRHRGRSAMLIAGVGLATLPVTTFESSAFKLEPFLILFVLLGLLTVLPQPDCRISTRRLVGGGVLFGIAALVKIWAIFPFVALVVILMPSCRKRVAVVIGSAGASFLTLALPFLVTAPGQFVTQVITEQLKRKALPTNNGGAIERLSYMTGFTYTSLAPTRSELIVISAGLLILVVTAYFPRIENETVDLYLLLAAAVSVGAILGAPEAYVYYGYFTAPFLLGVVAVSVARLGLWVRRREPKFFRRGGRRRIGRWTSALVLAVLALTLIDQEVSLYSVIANDSLYQNVPYSAITNLIPPGSCVLYDQVIYGIFSNRFESSKPSCPHIVDAGAMWFPWGYQLLAPAPPFVAEWQRYFEAARYVVLTSPNTMSIPWTQSLVHWFNRNYYLLYRGYGLFIYQRN